MEDKLDITELLVNGTARKTERAGLSLHPVGLSWGIEFVTDDMEMRGQRSGDTLQLEMETAEGRITGEAKVLRVIDGVDTGTVEMFGASDLMIGEELFRAQYM